MCSVRPRRHRVTAPAPSPSASPPARLQADQAFIRQLPSLVECIFQLGERDVGVDEVHQLLLERRDPVTSLTLSFLARRHLVVVGGGHARAQILHRQLLMASPDTSVVTSEPRLEF